jgi:fructose-bisphosphate aldolase class II
MRVLRVAWRRGLEDGLAKQPDEIVPYRILPSAVDAVTRGAGLRLNERRKMTLPA